MYTYTGHCSNITVAISCQNIDCDSAQPHFNSKTLQPKIHNTFNKTKNKTSNKSSNCDQPNKYWIYGGVNIIYFNITSLDTTTSSLDCHGDHNNDDRPARSVPTEEALSFSLRPLSGFGCHEVIDLGVDLNDIGKVSLVRQERPTTRSLLFNAWAKIRSDEIQFRKASPSVETVVTTCHSTIVANTILQ